MPGTPNVRVSQLLYIGCVPKVEKRVVGPVTPVLQPHQQFLDHLALARERELLQILGRCIEETDCRLGRTVRASLWKGQQKLLI